MPFIALAEVQQSIGVVSLIVALANSVALLAISIRFRSRALATIRFYLRAATTVPTIKWASTYLMRRKAPNTGAGDRRGGSDRMAGRTPEEERERLAAGPRPRPGVPPASPSPSPSASEPEPLNTQPSPAHPTLTETEASVYHTPPNC